MKLSQKKSTFKFYVIAFLLLGFFLQGCGRLWGGLGRGGSSGSTVLQDIFGIFVGAIGKTSATTGTCPGGNLAASTWCTGGTFANGTSDGMFFQPKGNTVDSTNGYLYTSEALSGKLSKFTLSTGAFIGAIGSLSTSTGTCPGAGAAAGWCTGGTFMSGSGDGMYSQLNGIVADPIGGYIYAADTGNNRVVKIDISTGAFVGAIGKTTATSGTCPGGGAPAVVVMVVDVNVCVFAIAVFLILVFFIFILVFLIFAV
jgi:DNA-binding beta-propeller fold protein YncE